MEESRSNAKMYGHELDPSYILAEIHFHWGYNASTGSEHSVKNKFYAMEAHLVHFSSKYSNVSMAAASGDPSALAVLGVFIAEGKEKSSNEGFDTIAANIPQYDFIMRKLCHNYRENFKCFRSSGNAMHVQQNINLLSFLPKSKQTFYRYSGSLTTPECNEIVLWTVVRNPIYVKPSLIQKFRDLKHIGANYRPIQKRGRRSVKYFAKK